MPIAVPLMVIKVSGWEIRAGKFPKLNDLHHNDGDYSPPTKYFRIVLFILKTDI